MWPTPSYVNIYWFATGFFLYMLSGKSSSAKELISYDSLQLASRGNPMDHTNYILHIVICADFPAFWHSNCNPHKDRLSIDLATSNPKNRLFVCRLYLLLNVFFGGAVMHPASTRTAIEVYIISTSPLSQSAWTTSVDISALGCMNPF